MLAYIKKKVKQVVYNLPYVKALRRELESYKTQYKPGHFYSPIVSTDLVRKHEDEIFTIHTKSLPGIELNEEQQLSLLHHWKDLYKEIPFKEDKSDEFRYYYNNTYYSFSDAIFLHLMMRHFKPRKIVEVGSGFSSAVMLDTNERFLHNKVEFTFVEPYPERLYSVFKESDKFHHVVVKDLQDVQLTVFDALDENDILFIDSTHVSKTGSDVNKIFFEILPRLKKGVLIHFHDVFYPFEYPKHWVLDWKGFGWNEAYLLRSFMMYNKEFEIVFFNTFLEHFHKEWFRQNMPLCLKDEGGSIWLQKV